MGTLLSVHSNNPFSIITKPQIEQIILKKSNISTPLNYMGTNSVSLPMCASSRVRQFEAGFKFEASHVAEDCSDSTIYSHKSPPTIHLSQMLGRWMKMGLT